jgi:hypothetical protein
MVASAKTTVSAQRERGEDCTGIANEYRVATRIASRLRQAISGIFPVIALGGPTGTPAP